MDNIEDDCGGCEAASSFFEQSQDLSPVSPTSTSSTSEEQKQNCLSSPFASSHNVFDEPELSISQQHESLYTTFSSRDDDALTSEEAAAAGRASYSNVPSSSSVLMSSHGSSSRSSNYSISIGTSSSSDCYITSTDDPNTSMLDYDEGIEDVKSYDIGFQEMQQREIRQLMTSNNNSSNNNNKSSSSNNNNNRKVLEVTNCDIEEEDEEEHSTASNDDVSSGFGSGGGYDNLSYGVGLCVGVDMNKLIIDPNSALLLDLDDFGDCAEDNDEDLDTPVERLVRRSGCQNSKARWDHSSSLMARENVCISIPSTLHQVMENPDDVDALMRLVEKLADDPNQSVRIELMEQIPQLTVLCHEYPQHLARVMDQHLLPLTIKHVNNQLCQVRKTTQAALLVVLEQRLLAPHQVDVLCSAVAALTEQTTDRTEDDRSDGLALMSRMAPILGRDLMLQHFLGRFTALCADSLWQIRKICAANFGEFTAITGTHTTEAVLLALFVSLCKDNVWEVRKSCCESFMEVSSSCLPVTRHASLAPIFVSLLTDQSRWVRVAAFQNLGMFISTFAAPDALDRRSPTFQDTEDTMTSLDVSMDCGDPRACCPTPPTTSTTEADYFFSDAITQHHQSTTSCPPTDATTDDSEYNSFNFWRITLPLVDLPEIEGIVPSSSCFKTNNDPESCQKDWPETEEGASSAENSTHTISSSNAGEEDSILESLAQAAVAKLSISEDGLSVPSTTRRHRVRPKEEEDADKTCVLERASEPIQFSEVLVETDKEDKVEDDLNTSADSTDSDDTIIELSTLSQGLLSIEDDDNTSDAFREGFRDRFDRQDTVEGRDLWLAVLDNNSMSASMDSSTAREISDKVQKQSVVPQSLLEQFLLMVDPRRSETEEKDITRHCAFAMPAVALTLGRENWPVLRDTYLHLAQNYQWRVRRTLAYSMHQMASILGGHHAAADLLPLYREFTVNEPECVRIGVLENLAEFVRVLPPAQRKAMLPTMKYFFGINDRRHRQEFGRQLVQLLKLYPPADCEEHLKLYCLILLTDNVVYNRQRCYGLISLLIERLGCDSDTHYVVGVCDALCRKFALDSTWCRRQTFVFVAGRVFADDVLDIKLYCECLLPQLLTLAQDRVPNVRLAVAEALTNHIINHEYFQDRSNPESNEVHRVYQCLQEDRDRDVRDFARSPLTPSEVEALHGEKITARNEHIDCHSSNYSGNQLLGINRSLSPDLHGNVLSRVFVDNPPDLVDEAIEHISFPSSPCLSDQLIDNVTISLSSASCGSNILTTHLSDTGPAVKTIPVPLLSPGFVTDTAFSYLDNYSTPVPSPSESSVIGPHDASSEEDSNSATFQD